MTSSGRGNISQQVFDRGSFVFSSDFDSGNLAGVDEIRSEDGVPTFNLSLGSDCQGTEYETEYRMWYYFTVQSGSIGSRGRFCISNLSPMVKVYCSDLRPLVRVSTLGPNWERLLDRAEVDLSEPGRLQLWFEYTFATTDAVSFALYYPFSYGDCQRLLRNIDQVLGTRPSTAADGDGSTSSKGASMRDSAGNSHAAALRARFRSKGDPAADVYYHRELLTLTPEGRRVELLTVSSMAGRQSEREGDLEGLFPDRGPRPFRFGSKPCLWISARVHPGETASSYVIHGLLAFLLQPRNPWARALRNRFVIKIVPMLNPDGVARGHFRTDCFGVNLNRAYGAPRADRAPAIFGVRAVLRQVAANCTPAPSDGAKRHGTTGLWCFLDLHGFTARQGCYFLGNSLPPHREARSLVFANLLQLYAPQFNANACSFGRAKKTQRGRQGYSTPYGHTPPPETVVVDTDDTDTESGVDSGRAGGTPLVGGGGEEESYPSRLAGLEDPWGFEPETLPFGLQRCDARAKLNEAEHGRASRDWAGVKQRAATLMAGTETQKDGTARVWAHRELGCAHAYTIESSCNLLDHTRVYNRVFAGAHFHVPAGTPHGEAHGVEGKKTVLCVRASAGPVSQLTVAQAVAWRAAQDTGSSHRTSTCRVLERVPHYTRHRRPYACQVESLQPPRDALDYVPPFGFPRSPAAGPEHVCPWGTCPFDPPACFAAVGRGLAMALVDLAGGASGVDSRVAESQWGSLLNLHQWSRRLCGVTYATEVPKIQPAPTSKPTSSAASSTKKSVRPPRPRRTASPTSTASLSTPAPRVDIAANLLPQTNTPSSPPTTSSSSKTLQKRIQSTNGMRRSLLGSAGRNAISRSRSMSDAATQQSTSSTAAKTTASSDPAMKLLRDLARMPQTPQTERTRRRKTKRRSSNSKTAL